ncbi:UNVERIFIED_CONTAM: T-complex protein 1 subunit theta [Sesamum indicum]
MNFRYMRPWAQHVLSDEQASHLILPFTLEDVKLAVFDNADDKAPGLDGFSSGFFKAVWSVVGSEVTNVVLNFFTTGRLLKQINSTLLALIPEVHSPMTVADFRPISCCNVLYKIIAKLLVQRLSVVLDKLISPYQAAFIPGIRGQHYDNTRTLYQLQSNAVTTELCCNSSGFSVVFMKWIEECVTTTSFSVGMNGKPHGRSTLAIPICTCDGGDAPGIFTDDRPGRGLYLPMEMSGLRVNVEKSHLIISRSAQGLKEQMLAVLGFQEGLLPMRYLGFPLISSKLSISDCQPLLKKIDECIAGWEGVIKNIEKRLRTFLWKGTGSNGYVKGGQELRDISTMNHALICKKLCDVIRCDRTSIWVDWLYQGRLRDASIWTIPDHRGSWGWKKIARLRTWLRPMWNTILEMEVTFISRRTHGIISVLLWRDSGGGRSSLVFMNPLDLALSSREYLEITHTLPPIHGDNDRIVWRFAGGIPTTQALYRLFDPSGSKVVADAFTLLDKLYALRGLIEIGRRMLSELQGGEGRTPSKQISSILAKMVGFSMQPYGIQTMLKEGHRHLSGLDEAVLKNIDACKQLSTITRTSLGPNGMNKMVINHLDKLFVTNDAGTIVNELEVQHPAAKILVLAGKAQQEEIGDGANLTISFAGELLQNAEELIRMGLHPSEIIIGYTKAINKTVVILEELVEEGSESMNVRDKDDVISRMRSAVASKQFGQEDVLCPLIAEACMQVCPKNPVNFNVDNVRVAKLLGGGLHDSVVVRGMVLKSDAVGTIKRVEKAKVAVFVGGVDTTATETKGTVLIHNAEQLENYAKTEEAKVQEIIKAVADSGAKVIVSGAAVGEMALHFCERYKLMVLKISSKFELRRFCRTTGAVALLKLSQPNPDDLGYVDSVLVEEIGGARVTIVKNEQGGNSVSTVVLRGSTDSILDDLERAVDDGVNTYRAMCRDSRTVPGAAATEIELARRLKEFSFKETGLDQYAIAKFAESFEMIPKTLAENAGLNAIEIISSLYAEHASGNNKVGIHLEDGVCRDVSTMHIRDLHITKFFALKYAADAACTVLRVDQIIMAKPAGGPKRDAPAGMDED